MRRQHLITSYNEFYQIDKTIHFCIKMNGFIAQFFKVRNKGLFKINENYTFIFIIYHPYSLLVSFFLFQIYIRFISRNINFILTFLFFFFTAYLTNSVNSSLIQSCISSTQVNQIICCESQDPVYFLMDAYDVLLLLYSLFTLPTLVTP